MLLSAKKMIGYRLNAVDDMVGTVSDFLFDEARWTIRWIVVDTGKWLPGRKVLISPISVGTPDWNASVFPVRMTREEIENSPGLGFDEPVSRQYEQRYFDQFGWPYYWSGTGYWGTAPSPVAVAPRAQKAQSVEESPEAGTDVLRSIQEVIDYGIQATDDSIGHVEDFVMEEENWVLRYLVVDTRNWLPGRKVLVSVDWIKSMHWTESKVTVDLTRDAIKVSPEYDPGTPINRGYEARLYDYYGRPVYW